MIRPDFREFDNCTELYHFGIPRRSGRYPWGSGNRPFQSGGGPMSKRQAKKAEKLRSKEVSKMTPEEREADKQRVLKTGTASEILRYKGELTNQEMQQAVTRLNLESQLNSLSSKDIESGMQKIDKVMKGVKTGTEWVKIGTDTWNTLARIYNSTEEGQKNPLTIIGEGKKKKGGD